MLCGHRVEMTYDDGTSDEAFEFEHADPGEEVEFAKSLLEVGMVNYYAFYSTVGVVRHMPPVSARSFLLRTLRSSCVRLHA